LAFTVHLQSGTDPNFERREPPGLGSAPFLGIR
jgi:hypothetical protein